jgi:hypothetical protein
VRTLETRDYSREVTNLAGLVHAFLALMREEVSSDHIVGLFDVTGFCFRFKEKRFGFLDVPRVFHVRPPSIPN